MLCYGKERQTKEKDFTFDNKIFFFCMLLHIMLRKSEERQTKEKMMLSVIQYFLSAFASNAMQNQGNADKCPPDPGSLNL